MPSMEWFLVCFGGAIMLPGAWIQRNPQRLFPTGPQWRPDPAALAHVSRLGASFVFMGAFFAAQLSADLVHLPWWTGASAGAVVGFLTVRLLRVPPRQRAL